MNIFRKQPGFTLIEMLVVIAVSTVILGALFVTVDYTVRIIANSRARTSALSLANDRLEYLRSLPYDEVGTVAGIPAGLIPQTSTTTLNGVVFTERVLVEYIDDPADGVLTATTTDSNGIPADYKRAKVELTWSIYNETESISLVTNIVPRSIETTDGGGTVRVNVIGADSLPLAGASVTLVNNTTTTTISVTKFSDASGTVLFSGAPAASNYEVIVTKAGYSTDQTYVSNVSNPNPITAPFSVLEADISTLTFQIGELSNIVFTTFSDIADGRRDEWFDDVTGIATSTNVAVSSGVLQLEDVAGVYDTNGQVYLAPLAPMTIEQWGTVTVSGIAPTNTDYRVRMYTASGTTYTIVPDADLPGNSVGFTDPIIDISNLAMADYPNLVVGINLSTSNSGVTPTIDAVEMFYRESETPRSGVAFTAHGAKVIGYDLSAQPIYKEELSVTTDGSGEASFTNIEFDSYEFTFGGAYTVARSCPTLPLLHQAGIDSDVETVLVGSVTDSLLVSVADSSGRAIPGALVLLDRSGFSDSGRTGGCGQMFFSSGVSAAADYVITVSKSGYDSEIVNPFDLNGNSSITVILNES